MRLCVFASIISFAAFTQTVEVTKSTRIEKIEGKEYYIHKIVKGQTLYSLSKAYNVLISEIIFENPDAIDGIKPDMELRIPAASNSLNTIAVKDKPIQINGKYRIHIVAKGQTLYSVAKLYNVTVDELKQANPGITETLSTDQKLNVPVEQLVKTGETVFTTGITETKKIDERINTDDKLSVVLLLPIFLDENRYAKSDTSASVSHGGMYAKSLNGLEFYEGAKLAIDSLSKAGINAVVHTFDIPDDASLTKVLANPVLKNADIIIGPFFGKRFETVAAFAAENKIACVTPVLKKSALAETNPYVSKVFPSDEMQIRQMGDFIGRWNCKKNIIVLHTTNSADSLLYDALVSGIKGRCDDTTKLHVISAKTRATKLVDSLLVPGIENIIVSFSKDESYISRLVLYLEKKNNKQRTVTLFGLDEWQELENIEVEYFQNVNLHVPADVFVDYDKKEVKYFLNVFRDKYLAEPGKYGFLGYDITMYYLQMLKKYGREFYNNPASIHATGLQTTFDFKKVAEQGGLENQSTFILNYNDYRLVKVN